MSDDHHSLIFKFTVLIVIGMVVQLGVIAFVVYSSYQGRVDLVQSQRAGCERGKLDRGANAQGWRIAEAARRRDGEFDVANRYHKIADGLEARSQIVCRKVFPDAGVFP
jgi:hypothetical protein